MTQDIFKALGFDRNPFSMAADTDGYFHTDGTKQILDELSFGILSRKGFLLLTGEVGVGKTSLLYQLLRRLEGENLVTSWIFNTMLNKEELLGAIARDFGLDAPKEANVAQLVEMLQVFLVDENAKEHNCAIIVDEAHNLSLPAMEALRMLSNLELSGRKLVQILLVGQPELKERLDERKLRQLRSRITIFRELHPFDQEETGRYVNFQLSSASSQYRLDKKALKLLYRASLGNTRTINLVMERSLYAAVALGEKDLTVRVLREAVNEIATCQLEVAERLGARKRTLRQVALAAGILLLFGASLVPVFDIDGRTRSALGVASELYLPSFGGDGNAQTAAAVPHIGGQEASSASAQEKYSPVPQQSAAIMEPKEDVASIPGDDKQPEIAVPSQSSTSGDAAEQGAEADSTRDFPKSYRSFLEAFGVEDRLEVFARAVDRGDVSLFEAALPDSLQLLKLDKLPQGAPTKFASFSWSEVTGDGAKWIVLWKPPFEVQDFYYGYRHENILTLQRWLKRLGYYWGPDDGMVGPVTWRAINSFQKDLKLKRTMWPDSETVFWLNAMSKQG